MAHCDPKVSTIHQKQTVLPNISHLPVFKLNLMRDGSEDISVNQKDSSTSNNQTKGLPLFCSTKKQPDEWPHILAYRLGVTPPQQTQESGVVCGIRLHKCKCPQKMKELGIGGENILSSIIFQAVTETCADTPKNEQKRRSSGELGSNFPSLWLARPITFCPLT